MAIDVVLLLVCSICHQNRFVEQLPTLDMKDICIHTLNPANNEMVIKMSFSGMYRALAKIQLPSLANKIQNAQT